MENYSEMGRKGGNDNSEFGGGWSGYSEFDGERGGGKKEKKLSSELGEGDGSWICRIGGEGSKFPLVPPPPPPLFFKMSQP